MSINEQKNAGYPPASLAATNRPAAVDEGENWRDLMNGLSKAVDELYSQHLFNNAEERLQATKKLLTQRLGHFRDGVVREVISSLQVRMDIPRPTESRVEVTVLETQLQELQAQNRRLEENLEAVKREANHQQAENRRLTAHNEKLQADFKAKPGPDVNATVLATLEQTQFWPKAGEKSAPALVPQAGAVDGSVFASVVRLARACAGEQIVFDSEEQISGVFNRLGQTLEVLLQSALKLIHGRWQFRTEFIGATIMHSAKSFSLQTARSTNEVKKFIFAPDISEQEFAIRQQTLKEAMDELMLHQVALLDGYRTCVNDGTRKLLQVLDPAVLLQKLNERKVKLGPLEIPIHAIPLLYQWYLLNSYKQKHAELLVEDRRIFEKKMFRPAFIRGYETRMAAAKLEAPGTPTPASA